MKHIVSLAPNVTEILLELGVEEKILGTTEYSDLGDDMGSWLNPNYEKVERSRPDLVFTSDNLQREVVSELENRDLNTRHYEPSMFSDIYGLVTEISQEVKLGQEGRSLNKNIKRRVSAVEEFVNGKKRPIVYSEEWDCPPMAAGNWVPEMIHIAGGDYPFVDAGNRSKKVNADEYHSYDVDYFLSHICGKGQMNDFRDVRDTGWMFPDETYFIHDNYLNQLSPKTVDGIEILASILHGYTIDENHHYKKKK